MQCPPTLPSPTSPEFWAAPADSPNSPSTSPELLPGDDTNGSSMPSPCYLPRSRAPSISYAPTEIASTVLPSPALAPTRPPVYSPQHAWSAVSPHLSPRQHYDSAESSTDHEASAVLLMMNRDRRGTIDLGNGYPDANTSLTAYEEGPTDGQEAKKRTSMSVRDLLNS